MPSCRDCGVDFRPNTHGRPAERCEVCRARYGHQHQQRRKATKAAAYGTACARCGEIMAEGQAIDLDHLDGGGPDDYLGWSHAGCNRGRRPVRHHTEIPPCPVCGSCVWDGIHHVEAA